MPTIDGTVFPAASAPLEYASEIDQEVFVSAGGTVHAWEKRSQHLLRIKFKILGLSQSQASALLDKYENVARGHRNSITLRMDGDASNRTVHFWQGRRGLRITKRRNDLYDAALEFVQVGGTPGLVP